MSAPISFRPSDEDRAVLDRLGTNPTDAIRTALRIAERKLADDALHAEAERLASDAAETAERRAIIEFMADVLDDVDE